MRHLGLPLLLLAAGCELDFESDAISITAFTDGTQTTVTICPGSDGLLDCREDVVFQVTVAGNSVIAEPELFGVLRAEFPIDGTDQLVTATREGGDAATVTIPKAFQVTTPATASRAAGVPTTWDPVDPESTMGWSIDASCPSAGSFMVTDAEVDDDGAITIPSSDFSDLPPREVCTVVITLERNRVGLVPDGFPAGSSIVGSQRRDSADVTLRP